jgi:hypothetical protein
MAKDKQDKARGVRQKILTYELFLNKQPPYVDKVVLTQIATSTTGQAGLDATVSDIVTRVNSAYSTLAHQPLVFLKHLEQAWKERSSRETTTIPRLSFTDLSEKYQAAEHRLFILEYEGNLASWGDPTNNQCTQ